MGTGQRQECSTYLGLEVNEPAILRIGWPNSAQAGGRFAGIILGDFKSS